MLSERAPRPPLFIGHSIWMSRTGSRPKRRRDAVAHDVHQLADAVLGLGGFHEVVIAVALAGFGEFRHLALVDAVRVDDDPALRRLPEHLRQPDHRHARRIR